MEQEQFDIVWSSLTEECGRMIARSNSVVFDDKCADRLLAKYNDIRDDIKNSYMTKEAKQRPVLIDRHKISASFMLAILLVRPLKSMVGDECVGKFFFLNEQLAITIGLSLMRAFVQKDDRNNLHKYLGDGFVLPDANNGSYIDVWCRELYWGARNGVLFVLSLSNELFLLEKYNLCLLNKTI